MKVTESYPSAVVKVKEGVVLVSGKVDSDEALTWLKDLSLKTEGVVAFVSKSEIAAPELANLDVTSKEIDSIQAKAQSMLPYIGSSGIIIGITILLAILINWLGRNVFFKKITNYFAKKTLARIITIPIFTLGLYLAFKVSGLTNLAVTVLGGTGLIGLGLGFAMKGFFENFFSSMVLSLRGQFNKGDFIEIEGFVGVIQSISTQGTILMDYDGNNIFIPNSKFMSSIFKNYTLNPQMRLCFIVGIGYDDNISKAQDVILKTLKNLNEIVLTEPTPTVCVKALASATVNLQVHFWIKYGSISDIKALSVVQKMVKQALMEAQISMPDDAREIVFASPLTISREEIKPKSKSKDQEVPSEDIDASELINDMDIIKKQAIDLEAKLNDDSIIK